MSALIPRPRRHGLDFLAITAALRLTRHMQISRLRLVISLVTADWRCNARRMIGALSRFSRRPVRRHAGAFPLRKFSHPLSPSKYCPHICTGSTLFADLDLCIAADLPPERCRSSCRIAEVMLSTSRRRRRCERCVDNRIFLMPARLDGHKLWSRSCRGLRRLAPYKFVTRAMRVP